MDLDEFLTVHECKSTDEKKDSRKQGRTSDLLSNLLQTVHKNLGIPRGNQPSAFRLPEEAEEKQPTDVPERSKSPDRTCLTDHEYIVKDCKVEYLSEGEGSEMSYSLKSDTDEVPCTQQGKTKRRKQRTYKYNPKPVQQKNNRKFVPEAQKDIEYWERRRRNNLAAKKSREDRRKKELEVLTRMSDLERRNDELAVKVKSLQKENERLEKSLQEALKK